MEIVIESLQEGVRRARGTVVVIDVLRAFTTAAVAFSRGARRVVMVESVARALALREAGAGDLCVGERGGARPAGFDHGNSPDQMTRADVAGRSIILATSNGTTGLDAAAPHAERLYAGALATAAATAAAILADRPSRVTLVAIGKDGTTRTEEDELCALYLRALLLGRRPDAAALGRALESLLPPADPGLLASGDYGATDRRHALAVDSIPLAIPVRREGGLLVAEPAWQR